MEEVEGKEVLEEMVVVKVVKEEVETVVVERVGVAKALHREGTVVARAEMVVMEVAKEEEMGMEEEVVEKVEEERVVVMAEGAMVVDKEEVTVVEMVVVGTVV